MAQRRASATWEGDLFGGSGKVSALSSGLFTDAGVTWASRTEDSEGRTSPEELIAGAHAACFAMALSNELASRGHVPSRVQIEAICTFLDGKITTMALDVSAAVPDVDEAGFREGLSAAEGSCPVSNALRGNVAITVDGRLV
ncbi:MAG: OsmC family peroxiredoxin [Actinomycetota bacterium]|jgi:osmotically inducible protein OsmC|nr:OsmC family peroxiredoxin [Actinomycetota bacterium]PLS74941.1 MAG: osmotically inducible protein OsmC [Actinomycetota bacterium]